MSKSVRRWNGLPFPDAPGWLLFTLALVAYTLPWIHGFGAGLTFGAYDWAEWASLPPQVRSAEPQLLAALLLRGQPVILALVVALVNGGDPTQRRGFSVVVVLATFAALLPPFEFFINARSDPNYGQQFTLAMGTLVAGGVCHLPLLTRWRALAAAVVCALGVVTSVWGAALAYDLMSSYQIEAQAGAGCALLVVCYLALGVMQITNQKRGSLSRPVMN